MSGIDFFGKRFDVGDVVACLKPGSGTSWLVYGIVMKLSEKTSLIFVDRYGDGEYDIKKLCDKYSDELKASGGDINIMTKKSRYINRRDNKGIIKHPDNINVLTRDEGVYEPSFDEVNAILRKLNNGRK
jgi:hypothetical protein